MSMMCLWQAALVSIILLRTLSHCVQGEHIWMDNGWEVDMFDLTFFIIIQNSWRPLCGLSHSPLYCAGWPASLPYICKIRVSVAIGTQSRTRLHERVPMNKIRGTSKNDQNRIMRKLFKFYKFTFAILHLVLVSTSVSQ